MLKNRQLSRTIAVVACCALSVVPPGMAFDQKTAAADDRDKAVFETVCGACHPPGMADDIRSEPDWRETVDQMVNIGAKATAQQLESVMRFLIRNQTKVNVNTASASEIAPVLAIDDTTARAVVTRRKQIGSFKSIADLAKVPGVDAAKLEARRDRIVF